MNLSLTSRCYRCNVALEISQSINTINITIEKEYGVFGRTCAFWQGFRLVFDKQIVNFEIGQE